MTVSVILILSFIIVYDVLIKIYSVLFRITGMTKEKARFQVISLLSGCGYTTHESEIVADDVIRRKIAKAGMLTGYAFSVVIVSLILNLLLNLKEETTEDTLAFISLAFLIFIVLIIFSKLPFVTKFTESVIEKIASSVLNRGAHDNKIVLLDTFGDQAICEISINQLPDFMRNRSICECGLKDKYKINLMMLKRKNKIIEITKDTVVQCKDSIVVFGPYQLINDAFKNKGGTEEQKDQNKYYEEEKNTIDIVENYGENAVVEVYIRNIPRLMKYRELDIGRISKEYDIKILMVKRKGKTLDLKHAQEIQEKDILVVYGPYANIKTLFLYDGVVEVSKTYKV